ncbi:MAG: hypothetical protein RIC55_28570 [Pirellulaceae bacterium]
MTSVAGVLFEQSTSIAQVPSAGAEQHMPRGELIALSHDLGEGRQQVTVIDPKMRVMAVYHVDPTSGEITLKSVRNIHWDLQMEEFNGVNPSPRDIRALLEQR